MRFSFRSIDARDLDLQSKNIEMRFTDAVRWAGNAVQEIAVTVRDCNGPKGGIDKICRVTVSLTRTRRLILEDRDSNPFAALARLVDRTSRSVHAVLDRKRSRASVRYFPAMEHQG